MKQTCANAQDRVDREGGVCGLSDYFLRFGQFHFVTQYFPRNQRRTLKNASFLATGGHLSEDDFRAYTYPAALLMTNAINVHFERRSKREREVILGTLGSSRRHSCTVNVFSSAVPLAPSLLFAYTCRYRLQ